MRSRAARRSRSKRGSTAAAMLAAVLFAANCAVNPATGERQLALIGEGQEIEMGREASQHVDRQIGLYDDEALQSYVGGVASRLAAASERPDLPWRFQVADDPVVNAFALPGGFIYLTRGILAHFNSEAEMAAVLGHEIGHVTARHSVQQISRAQLAQVGLGLGAIFVEPMRGALGDVAAAGLGVLFLQYSRDHEREADMLGIRYMLRENYDPREAVHVFEMLQRQAEMAGAGAMPNWLSTHPTPEDRIERIEAIVDTVAPERLAQTLVEEEAFLQRLDGLVFGPNPRHGFFQENRFSHPDLQFRMSFPQGWATQNMAQAVMAMSPREDALMQLTLSQVQGHQAAADQFFRQQGIEAGRVQRQNINGNPASVGAFRAQTQQGILEGIAAFLDYGGNTYQIMGYTPQGRFGAYDREIRGSIGSFDRLTDRAALAVQPMRIELVRTQNQTSIADLAQRRSAPVSPARLALLNGVQEQEALPAGRLIKWVSGNRPPGMEEPAS